MAQLDEYKRKRNFKRTPEPAGSPAGKRTGGGKRGKGGNAFVIHKHAARQLHFDLRLENNGVLESWAVPKGPSMETGVKRLAVQVEDHPIDYGDFEGTIPKKEYGGGTIMIWDRGEWTETHRSDGRIDFLLDGYKLSGSWTLTRTGKSKRKGRDNWLLIKRSDSKALYRPPSDVAIDRSVVTGRTMAQISKGEDPAAAESRPAPASTNGRVRPQRARAPRHLKPQLATLVDSVPSGPEWLHEIKFDGYRIIASLENGSVQLWSRNGKDWTGRFSSIAESLEKIPAASAVLDGEVVAMESNGVSSFRKLQQALSEDRTDDLVYQVFDLMHLDGASLRDTPLNKRKRALSELLDVASFKGNETVRFTEHLEGDGAKLLEHACELGLEGIISKHAEARYRATRNRQWRKIKCVRHDELLVGGYTEPAGKRVGFGALLLGTRSDAGKLVYAGKVGTGFSDRQLKSLFARLRKLETADCPFVSCPEHEGAHWVRPELIAEVQFSEWTRDGRLRHPSFRGLREDKSPEDIRMSQPPVSDESPARGKSQSSRKNQVAGVPLSNPDRILYPDQGITKLELAHYYEEIASWILPQVRNRPLSLLRCPQGRAKECFFQKHPGDAISRHIPRIDIREKSGKSSYLYIERLSDLVALVQAGTLELHIWGCTVSDLERPDTLVFDLDPGPGVSWPAVIEASRALQDRLRDLGLTSFVRLTGGKGLHVVTPVKQKSGWDDVKAFARGVANAHAQEHPKKFTINMSKARRRGRIFIDYLRNGRGATAIASYSTRARKGAPVAVPIRWDELAPSLTSNRYNVVSVRRRLGALRSDPWEGFEESRRPVTRKMLAAVGVRGD